MSKKSNMTGGSASIVIIAVLFLALMGTLGVVFYQNFIDKPAANPSGNSPQTQTTATDTTRLAFESSIYAFDYPKTGWTLAPKTDTTSSVLTFLNKEETVRVSMSISRSAPVTSCSSSDNLQITYYQVSSQTVAKLVDAPLYLVESIYDHKDGGYQYKVGLVPDSGDTHASVGTTHCNVSHVGVASTALMNGKTLIRPTVLASIEFPKLGVTPQPTAPDMQTIRDLMATDDYKAAVKILQSARKE